MILTSDHSISSDVFLEGLGLRASENESQDSQKEAVEDANNCQDVGPSHFAVSKFVLASVWTTDFLDSVVIPTSRKDDTAKEHADCYKDKENSAKFNKSCHDGKREIELNWSCLQILRDCYISFVRLYISL